MEYKHEYKIDSEILMDLQQEIGDNVTSFSWIDTITPKITTTNPLTISEIRKIQFYFSGGGNRKLTQI